MLEELPARTEITRDVELSHEGAAFYEALRQRAIERLEEDDGAGAQHLAVLAEIMRWRRARCHPRLVDSLLQGADMTGKLTVEELLKMIRQ